MIIHPNAERIWSIATHYHEYIVRLIVDLECYQPFISPHITHQILKKRANHFSLQLFFFYEFMHMTHFHFDYNFHFYQDIWTVSLEKPI